MVWDDKTKKNLKGISPAYGACDQSIRETLKREGKGIITVIVVIELYFN